MKKFLKEVAEFVRWLLKQPMQLIATVACLVAMSTTWLSSRNDVLFWTWFVSQEIAFLFCGINIIRTRRRRAERNAIKAQLEFWDEQWTTETNQLALAVLKGTVGLATISTLPEGPGDEIPLLIDRLSTLHARRCREYKDALAQLEKL